MPFTPAALTSSFNFGSLDVLPILPSSGVAQISSAPAPSPSRLKITEYVQLYSKTTLSRQAATAWRSMATSMTSVCRVSDERTDECEGSIHNRVHFPLEVISAVVETAGAERPSRIYPLIKFQFQGPASTFIGCVRDAHPNFAYTHVVESRATNG
ncbi:hypothetical protein EDB86DRAFT_905452 [Lactarius hatsudake]|nr:hypothetical protein EDB86DRAFT_905452 [Lactarius hatsudake]